MGRRRKLIISPREREREREHSLFRKGGAILYANLLTEVCYETQNREEGAVITL